MLAFTASLPLSNCRASSTLGNTSSISTARNNALRMVLSNRESKNQKQLKSNMLKRPPVRRPEINEPLPIQNVEPIEPQPQAGEAGEEEMKDLNIPLRVTGNNIPMTDSLRGYVEEKLNKVLSRYDTLLTKMDVHLTVEHNPSIPNKNKAEVIAFVGKTILRTETRSDDMYSAIDIVQQRIIRVIRKFKERRDAKHHNKTSISQTSSTQLNMDNVNMMLEDDELMTKYKDLYDDSIRREIIPGIPPVTEVVKRKVLPMPLQSVEEAVLCCEYVDHPWYLFRNAETKEICLVYKRNHGGYGLIEPSNPNGKDEEEVM